MDRRTAHVPRLPRPAVAVAVVLGLLATSWGTSSAAIGSSGAVTPDAAGSWLAPSRAASTSTSVSSSVVKVVSSTGHKLRIHLLALRSGTASQVGLQVLTRDGAEEHDWTFQVPLSGVSVSKKGAGRIRLTSKRSARYAVVSLKVRPHGAAVRSTCHRKTATRTRHVSMSGTLLLHTRSKGRHAWGSVGSARKPMHFSTRSKVTWTLPAASNCQAPTIACRTAFAWQASGGPPGELELLASANKGAHAQIEGFRSVPLPEPAGAVRADLVLRPQKTPNQLIVNGDGSATMQATFRGGTGTLTAPAPATSTTERCSSGKKGSGKVHVDFWGASFANGPTPLRLPAQIFGAVTIADTPAAAIYRITLQHEATRGRHTGRCRCALS